MRALQNEVLFGEFGFEDEAAFGIQYFAVDYLEGVTSSRHTGKFDETNQLTGIVYTRSTFKTVRKEGVIGGG